MMSTIQDSLRQKQKLPTFPRSYRKNRVGAKKKSINWLKV